MAVIMPEDLIIRASTVEHELKHAFVNTPQRLVRMQINDHTTSFAVSFQKDEIFLRQLFCDCLFSNGLKYHKNDKGILLSENKHIASFLNSLYSAAKDLRNQLILMENRSEPLLASSSAFFADNKPQSGVHLRVQAGLGSN
ncbi:MAG: hypothetical protein V4496_07830 [Pseudomonadota bacterium]